MVREASSGNDESDVPQVGDLASIVPPTPHVTSSWGLMYLVVASLPA